MSNDINFGRQVDALVAENQHLRVKSDNDDKTLHLMQEQYKALAASVDSMRNKYERQIFQLTTERDDATVKHSKIKSLLLQAADIVMQAARADIGDETPERMPQQTGQHIQDDRLPIARLNQG
jgi:hypothetical protein